MAEKPKIFIICSFIEKVCWPLSYTRVGTTYLRFVCYDLPCQRGRSERKEKQTHSERQLCHFLEHDPGNSILLPEPRFPQLWNEGHTSLTVFLRGLGTLSVAYSLMAWTWSGSGPGLRGQTHWIQSPAQAFINSVSLRKLFIFLSLNLFIIQNGDGGEILSGVWCATRKCFEIFSTVSGTLAILDKRELISCFSPIPSLSHPTSVIMTLLSLN